MFKKGQTASGAATLVALVAGMLILYILFLPADVRQDLLGETGSISTSGGSSGSTDYGDVVIYNETIMEESPGRIDYLKFSEYEHQLSAVNLYTVTEAETLFSEESLYIKNGIFDKLFRNLTFTIDDLENTENILLSFNLERAKGRLSIYLNGEKIFDNEVTGIMDPLDLSDRNLEYENLLTFEVSDVGFAFWTTNEYQLTGIKITGDVTDISEQSSKNTFTVTDTEKFNIESVKMKFFPDCTPRGVGALKIYVNNENIYSSIPDCGQINIVEFSPSVISAGDNSVIFKTDEGTYLIYQIMVETELKEQTYPVYYFDLTETLFYFSEEYKHEQFLIERECGDVDDYCPVGCDEDLDIDCCFEGSNNYWCDIEPDDEDDRCASVTEADTSKCDRCVSGYEDDNGYAPEECEDRCGDDHDDYCPSGCSEYYDRDCCFEKDEDNFWCNDVPIYGLENVCETSLNENECDDCPSTYYSNGRSYSSECPSTGSDSYDEVMKVKPGYEVVLYLYFADDTEHKAAHVYINGHKSYVDTYSDDYMRTITDYVEEGSNSIKIEPDLTTLDIRKLVVEIEEY